VVLIKLKKVKNKVIDISYMGPILITERKEKSRMKAYKTGKKIAGCSVLVRTTVCSLCEGAYRCIM